MRLLVPDKRVCGNLPHSRKLEYTLMFGVKAKSGSRPLVFQSFSARRYDPRRRFAPLELHPHGEFATTTGFR